MNVHTKKQQKGFTIIEVILVLAIAALIFLMVFIALPALQRGQRDTQRKNDLARVSTSLTNYSSNNNGSLPKTTAQVNSFVSSYLASNGEQFKDPKTGSNYSLSYGTITPTAVGQMEYHDGASCGPNGAIQTGAGPRQFAVSVFLENGGAFCQDSGQ